MNQDSRHRFPEASCVSRPGSGMRWKRAALVTVAGALVLGLTGCTLDDILNPPIGGDIPFEQEQTAPTDMGAVDVSPTVRDDDYAFDDSDFRPL